jgi:hypothetical protein
MADKIYFSQYPYVGLSGDVYHPYTENGKWYIVPHREVSLERLAILCRIPEDEAVFLKLKYYNDGN